jgi:signal transduction histidine kinase/ActR/RegA family two-component response regulator
MQRLLRISLQVLAGATIDDILQRVASGARELTGALSGGAAFGPDGGGFLSSAASHEQPEPPDAEPDRLQGPQARVFNDHLQRRVSARLDSVTLEAPRQAARPGEEEHARCDLLAARLLDLDDRPAGLILVRDRQEGGFSPEDEALLNQLAALTTFALRHVESRNEALARAEEAEDGQRILDALMTYLPEGITIAEGPDVTIRMTSRYGRRMIARRQEDVEDIPAREQGERWNLLRPDGGAVEANQLPLSRAARRGEVVTNEELMLQQPDGTTIPVSCNSGPILDRQGRIVGAVMAWRDISDRKQAEQALLEADRRKDEFLAMLAHELRNPLSPLVNAAQILKRAADDPQLATEAIQVIERQVWHMVRLIDDLLDVSRITRGKIRLQKEHVELSMVIDSAVSANRQRMDAMGHKFSVTYPRTPIHLDADPTRVIQILSNLLRNAAKYTPRGGEVSLSAGMEGGQALIRVRDSGVGIEPGALPGLFRMFVQLETPVDGTREGLGVGLALARSLAQMHGGTVEAHSEGRGRGSEFVVRLPALADRQDPATVVRDPGPAPAAEQGLRILVVDDSADSASSLGTMLELMGHRVAVATEGQAALDLARRDPPDVAILDIGMPGMDGYELARRLRQRFAPEELLLVALTGWGKREDRRKASAAGFDHHLVKPASSTRLREVLERHAAARE